MNAGVEVRVLGPFELIVDGVAIGIPAAKERTLLAALGADACRPVSVGSLMAELWSENPPRSAAKTLQTYVSHLRRHLGERLRLEAAGYLLAPITTDADAFEASIAQGRLALLREDWHGAAGQLGDALALWRGDAYAGVDAGPRIAAEATRLDELRQSAAEDWFEARLMVGAHREVTAELEAAVAAHPLRERLWALLMRALYASGRQGEALRTFQRARVLLVEELGVEPGPELRAVETAILEHRLQAVSQVRDRPDVKYAATTDGTRIAYSVLGEGPTLVFLGDIFMNIELFWEFPGGPSLIEPLVREMRVVTVQPRGTGLSDRDADHVLAPPEISCDDIDVALDAAGVDDRIAMLGWGHGGQLALAYAATRPARVRCVAVMNGYARLIEDDDYPGLGRVFIDEFLKWVEKVWGAPMPKVPIFSTAVASDPTLISRVSRLERLTASPRYALQLHRALNEFDVRPFLSAVRCPVFVLYLTESVTGRAAAKWLADALPSSLYREMPGAFVPTAEEGSAAGEVIAQFLKPAPDRPEAPA